MEGASYRAASAVLCWFMLLLASMMRSREWTLPGMKVSFGNRDNMPEADVTTARRAGGAQTRNMVENLALFTAVPVAAWMAGAPASRLSLPCALFFWTRLACFPTYVAGIAYLRTAIWSVGVAGLAMPAGEAMTVAPS
jgi:uncharacterized MAPEG superfamily protein